MRRLQMVQSHVVGRDIVELPCSAPLGGDGLLFDFFTGVPSSASVGKVVVPLVRPVFPELVPFGIVPSHVFTFENESVLETLQWMMKKHLIGQDMFLLAPPGPAARWMAFKFCELLARECLVISMTPDTTESDLKQRREIQGRNLVFVDSAAVEAAKKGYVLIVEGLELAERGVATVLNNLLENREMQLEDGTFLTMRSVDETERSKHNFVQVDPRFRVIVVGSPTPRYPGNPLDPPLRSRFQYRWISPSEPPSRRLAALSASFPTADSNSLRGLVSFASSLSATPTTPPLPHDALFYVADLLQRYPHSSVARLLHQAYPHRAMALEDPAVAAVEAGLKWLHWDEDKPLLLAALENGEAVASDGSRLPVARGVVEEKLPLDAPLFALLADVVGNAKSHVLVLGDRGSGKTRLLREAASLLGVHLVSMQLFEDLGARDLLQKRSTDELGDTVWFDSELVAAAKRGGWVVLDGLEQLRPGVVASVQRLLQDHEADLPDGTRLVSSQRFEALKRKTQSEERMKQLRLVAVHPLFRVLATGQTATKKKPWINSLVLSVFKVHVLSACSAEKTARVLASCGAGAEVVSALLQLNASLSVLADASLAVLSLRQLLRLARKPLHKLRDAVLTSFLAPFLPLAARTQLEAILNEAKLKEEKKDQRKLDIVIEKDRVQIGDVVGRRSVQADEALIPKVSFFGVDAHLKMLEEMLEDWNNEEHLLLIGNQGVGKNVLADKLLQLLRREREYVQVHRDTTVLSLTLAPKLAGGVVVWEDSPLVRAVQFGRVLVIDEVDKAPLEVVVVLKSLLEDGEMTLGDGRRCARAEMLVGAPPEQRSLAVHPNFRVIALANRPGFPFLGNNFFARVGDCFAAHVVGNVDEDSELQMLRSYGPAVPDFLLVRLVRLFGELRGMVDAGTLQHPYSLRELVQIVKHLNQFPDNLAAVLHNVFSLDLSTAAVAPLLREVLQRNGVPIDVTTRPRVVRARFRAFEERPARMWTWHRHNEHTALASTAAPLIRHRPWKWRPEHVSRIRGRLQGRIDQFSELVFSFSLPLRYVAADCVHSRSGQTHILLSSPVQLLSYDADFLHYSAVDISAHLPYHRSSLPARPRLFAVSVAGVDLLLVFLPLYRVIIVVDEAGAFATPVQIPALDGGSGDASVFNEQMFPDAAALRGGAKLTQIALGHLTVAAWCHGGRVICFMDVVSLVWSESSVALPCDIDRAVFVGRDEWIVQSPYRELVLLNQQSMLLRQFSTSAVVPLLSAFATGVLGTEQDLLAIQEEEEKWKCVQLLPDEGSRVLRSQRLGQDLALLQTDTALLLVDIANRAVRPLCGEKEEGKDEVVCFCELEKGQALVVRASGAVSVYDCDTEKLKAEESMWRVIVGLPEHSEADEGNQNEEKGGALTLLVGGVEVPGNVDKNRDSGKGKGSDSSGGSGRGSGGGDGVGTGGKSGTKREGDGGARDARGLEQREVDELQRAMMRKGLEEELAIINMGKSDLAEYREMVASVAGEIEQLRNVLIALEARGKERAWLKGKTTGDLDDTRLVENIVGDANVYKRRGQQAPRAFAPQEKPKRLLFCVDVSASMYRFNTQDQRLARLQALAVMVMEALDGDELARKYHYSIVGHSGDDCAIPLGAEFGAPPKGPKERLALVKKMVAHSEYCSSGDSSLEALREGVKKVAEQEADDYFVLLISDANLSRYGVDPAEFGLELARNVQVNAFALFIASFDNEAETMRSKMPLGKCYVTFDTAQLPSVFRQIFASTSFMRDQ